MKKLLTTLIVFSLASVCSAGWWGGTSLNSSTDANVRDINVGGSLRGVFIRGNSMWVTPEANLQTAYNALKSSTYDAAMGTLAVGSRRCLSISAGNYNQTLVLDTNYVDIVGTGASPNDVNIWFAGHGTTVTQICDDTRLTNFKIASSGAVAGDYGFSINASDNSPSVYRYVVFRKGNAASYGKETIFGFSNVAGLWEYCVGDNFSWRVDVNMNFNPTMLWCRAGTYSFGGDQNNVLSGTGTIGGKFYHCNAGDYGFGGCTAWGTPCDSGSYFEDCNAGKQSFAMGNNFAGTAIRCTAGINSFAFRTISRYSLWV